MDALPGLPAALLGYAAGEGEPARHEVVQVGKKLPVVALDLAGIPDAVLAQVAGVAERIDELRGASPS